MPAGSSRASASLTRLRARMASRSPRWARSCQIRRPSSTRSVDAPRPEPVGLAVVLVGRRELVDGHLGGDVLAAEVVHRVPAPVMTPIGAQPLGPGAGGHGGRRRDVVDDDQAAAQPGQDALDPLASLILPRGEARLRPVLSGIEGLAPDRQVERQVVQQLVGDDHADERAVGQIGRRLEALVPGPLGPRTVDGHVAVGAAGQRQAAAQRARPGPGVVHGEGVGSTLRIPPGVQRADEHGPEEGPDLWGGEEVAAPPGASPLPLVEPLRPVERGLHDLRERRRDQGIALAARLATSPKWVTRPGKMPKASVPMTAMPRAALSENGTRMDVVSPSGASWNHIRRATLA